VIGIEVNRVYLVTFLMGSALAGVAAVLTSFDTGITPMMGFYALLMGVVAVIVGGIGNLYGAALGGLFLGLAQHLAVWLIGSQWQDATAFLIMVVFLSFRPYGFFGFKLKKAQV
jgi:branched-chain amino acid transport system permease protein